MGETRDGVPSTRALEPDVNFSLNPLKAPVKIILQTMIVLRDFTDNTELRNNSQVDKSEFCELFRGYIGSGTLGVSPNKNWMRA